VLANHATVHPLAVALQQRTHEFFVRVIAFCKSIPQRPEGRSIRMQLVGSAGGADRNYRAACKARSRKEFIAKIGVAAEEADETVGWLQALRDAGLGDPDSLAALINEANELTSIFVSSGRTARRRLADEKVKGNADC
jgi:four helix bundle protein